MTSTLFGGMVLIAALYFALRLAGVSNYWRGVISGIIPTLGIMLYSMSHWAGADMLALHLALFVATATVLTLSGSAQTVVGSRMHWIPATFITFFILLAVLMAMFLNVAMHGLPPGVAKWVLPNAQEKTVYTAFSGEVPHDEEAAKTVSQYMKKTEQQRQLGWKIEVGGLDGLHPGQAGEVDVTLSDKADQPLQDANVQLLLKRPVGGQAGKPIEFAARGAGKYQGQVLLEQPGHWVAVLSIVRGQDKYETAKEIRVAEMQQ
ncbi:MAG: FixH family protein [Sulfuricellaceae bacterium]